MQEIEVKIPVSELDAAEARVRESGFRAAGPAQFERNILFDTAAGDLQRTKRLLRIREAGGRTILTVKMPPVEGGRHKVREEREVEVSDAAEAAALFQGLGYEPAWTYEKRRTTYRRGGEPGVIEVDDTPIGGYLELEGAPEWIDRTAAELGFTPEDYSTASYWTLFVEWKTRTGSLVRDMVFEAE